MTARWELPGKFREPSGALAVFGVDSLPGTRVTGTDPPTSERQRRMMGAELAWLRAGQKTRTGMTEEQLREFARKPKGGYRR